MGFNIPKEVINAIEILEKNGHEAFLVGGSVRDYVMGKTPNDYDLCTSALPEEMLECFKDFRLIETGLKHGTVTVLMNPDGEDKMPLEITTYRIDGEYEDGRHPEEVTFTKSITEDLARRDFTMNAIAYSPSAGFVDPFEGTKDIELGIIRTVGEPSQRFSEDALRIMRGLRFSACLGFEIEAETATAMDELAETVKNISPERIQAEISKLIMGDYATKTLDDYHGIFAKILGYIAAAELNKAPRSIPFRLALIFPNDTGKILQELRFDNATIKRSVGFAEMLSGDVPENKIAIKRLMRKHGEFEVFTYMEHFKRENEILEILRDKECWSLGNLAIKGSDLIAAGVPRGKAVGEYLEELLDKVIEGKLPNDREVLLSQIELPKIKRGSNVWLLTFSPNGNTHKIGEAVASGIGDALGRMVNLIDVTMPDAREKAYEFCSDDAVVFAFPTYAGRIPNKIEPFLREKVKGNGAQAVAIVSYGNRAYDESLKELVCIARDDDFVVSGAGAFVAEHAFAEELGAGRPKAQDIELAYEFGKVLVNGKGESGIFREKQREGLFVKTIDELIGDGIIGPYYVPLKRNGKPASFLKAKPLLATDICEECGECIKVCPMGSIDEEFETTGTCIKCQACVKKCKIGAREFIDRDFSEHREMLLENYAKPQKEAEFYL